MALGPPPFVDLHLHAEGISDADLTTLAGFGLRAAVTCANDAGASSAVELRRHWDGLVTVQVERLRAAGIRPWVALAVHPARIPWHGVDDLLHRLPRYFDDPRVVALGELGLHEGGEREEELLARQLELSLALRKPVIVHTPGQGKLAVTRRLLAVLRESRLTPARVLVDHVTEETFLLVRGCGHFAGLTLQPGLLEPADAAQPRRCARPASPRRSPGAPSTRGRFRSWAWRPSRTAPRRHARRRNARRRWPDAGDLEADAGTAQPGAGFAVGPPPTYDPSSPHGGFGCSSGGAVMGLELAVLLALAGLRRWRR